MSDELFLRRTTKNAFSGTIAGVSNILMAHPFDTLKVRLQTQPVHNPMYEGVADCFMKTIKNEGVGGLYKGVGSPLAGQVVFRAVLFSSYYQITHMQCVRSGRDRLHGADYFLCGAYTGAAISFVEGPIDLFKTKMQTTLLRARAGSQENYRHVFHLGYTIARQHGIRGVYQGFSGTLLRNIPGFSVVFGVYETLKEYFTPVGKTGPSLLGLVVSGAFTGIGFWVIYPLDVVKSSLMSDESLKSSRKYKGLVHCARILYRDEGGWRRFFRGFGICLVGAIPANMVLFVTLEKCRHYF